MNFKMTVWLVVMIYNNIPLYHKPIMPISDVVMTSDD